MRHAPTAIHSLRVALISSAWASFFNMAEPDQDRLEVAALLHDVGMIGLPDQILFKPGPLTAEEMVYVDRARFMTLEILRHVTDDQVLLKIVENVSAWFDGSRSGYSLSGLAIPLASRMIAVVEAYDAMITDHLYRPAMSEERAIAELYHFAGKQFDPDLVQEFVRFQRDGLESSREVIAHRWLAELDDKAVNQLWRWVPPARCITPPELETVFQHRLLQWMRDGVIFVDAHQLILQWNHGAERLSGIMADAVRSRQWSPTILGLRNERGQPIDETDCPILMAIKCGTQVLRRLSMKGRAGEPVSVDVHVVPVILEDGMIVGAVGIFHDASSEISLEQRLEYFRDRVSKDPLTQLANRAEFDRMLPLFVEQYQRRGLTFSLIICDLDRFKQVNDTYGHQAGDDAIRSLAAVFRGFYRNGDLIARYGGEEFVMLCAGCDIATATRRAEEMRAALEKTPQPRLNGRVVTASFGVTEVQPGDTPETILRRADRALLMAKSRGRNIVIQLGAGNNGETAQKPTSRWWSWPNVSKDLVWREDLISAIPLNLALEKLQGFIADHLGRVVFIEHDRLELEIEDRNPLRTRRAADRPICFGIRVELSAESCGATQPVRTRLRLEVWPKSGRERRRREVVLRAQDLITSFHSYLMVSEIKPESNPRVIDRLRELVSRFWRAALGCGGLPPLS
ncbi:MAG: diguanylate cyclase domain-containing protein [Thermogutta sp.]